MICISVEESTLKACLSILQNEKMAEIRLDKVNFNDDELKTIFSQPLKLIATCHPGKFPDKERFQKLKTAIEAGASYIDIEYESSKRYRNELIVFARNNNCKVIVSYHNFKITPKRFKLEKIIKESFKMGADISKVACWINNETELARILSLYEAGKKIIAFGMGEKGKLTRVIAPFLGAEFTYVSSQPGKETAPGQLSRQTMIEAIKYLEKLMKIDY